MHHQVRDRLSPPRSALKDAMVRNGMGASTSGPLGNQQAVPHEPCYGLCAQALLALHEGRRASRLGGGAGGDPTSMRHNNQGHSLTMPQ